MKPNEFQCGHCKGVFEFDWPEEEAEKELKKLYSDHKKEDCVILCDDCFNREEPFEGWKEQQCQS